MAPGRAHAATAFCRDSICWDVKGEQGSPGLSGYERVSEFFSGIRQPGSSISGGAACPDGKKVLGGGATVSGASVPGTSTGRSSYVTVRESWPSSTETEWWAALQNNYTDELSIRFYVYAVCAVVD